MNINNQIQNYLRGLTREEIKKVYKMIGEEINEWIEKGEDKLDENIIELLDTCIEIIKEERDKESKVNIDSDCEEAVFAGD